MSMEGTELVDGMAAEVDSVGSRFFLRLLLVDVCRGETPEVLLRRVVHLHQKFLDPPLVAANFLVLFVIFFNPLLGQVAWKYTVNWQVYNVRSSSR